MVGTEKLLCFRGPQTYGARGKPGRQPGRQPDRRRGAGTAAISERIEVKVDGQGETVEVDPIAGPRVQLDNGSFGRMDCLATGPKWSERSFWDQKVLCYMAAKRNRAARERAEREAERRLAAEAVEAELQRFAMLSPKEQMEHRCRAEMARPAIQWVPISIDDVKQNHELRAPGMIYGLEFPWDEDLLEEFGPAWLTKAFHAAGTMDKRTKVARVAVDRKFKVTGGNNAGKFLFSVTFTNPIGELHSKLFAKVPFAMNSATASDRYSSSVYKQPMDFYEINTYRLLEAFFPMKTPKFYYGDISNKTSNFILVTERILYSDVGGRTREQLKPYEIEGPYEKCKDFELRRPARDYYMLLVRQKAKIAAYHKTGKMGSNDLLRKNFSFPRPHFPEAYGVNPAGSSGEAPAAYERKLNAAIKYMSETARVIFPEYVTSPAFQAKFKSAMMTWSAYSGEIDFWKHSDEDYVAFGHQNLNSDNAYFWQADGGEMDCGIIDWGGFGSSNLPHKLWWMMNCAEFEMIKGHMRELIGQFVEMYREFGGPKLNSKTVEMMVWVTCFANISFMVAAVPNCYTMCSAAQWATVTDRGDPRIAGDVNGKSTLRTTHQVLINGVRAIEELKIDEVLRDWVDEVYVREFKQAPKSDSMIKGR